MTVNGLFGPDNVECLGSDIWARNHLKPPEITKYLLDRSLKLSLVDPTLS